MAIDLSTLMPQQREVVTTLDRPLFVSAGAGSGKTFTLTRRILWALSPESGPYVEHLDGVLAITFTKDAAAEIRERVRAALIDAGMDEEALSVDDAWISTIHGMCARILRAHALELGLDPEFSVIEETAAAELMDQAVDHVLSRVEQGGGTRGAGQGEHPFDALLGWYRLEGEPSPFGAARGASIREYVRQLLELSCALPGGMDDVRLWRGKVDFSSLRDMYRELSGGTAAQAAVARTALEALDAFEAGPQDARSLAACMMACLAKMPRAGKAFPKERVALLKAEAADAFINAHIACGQPALDQLLELAREVEAEYRRLKCERAAMDNNDLLRRTYEAFRDHEPVRAAFRDRFRLVMIDEFQDTDQQQVDLIGYLTGEGGRALCTVGDAQQSIYRFRGAEVEVFRRQQAAVAGLGGGAGDSSATAPAVPSPAAGSSSSAGKLVELVRNFRSHEEILQYVARVFDGRGGAGGLMPDFLDLEPDPGRRDGLIASGASRRQAVLVAGGSTDDRTAAKATAIARRFRALADAGQPVGGMVLLLGAMTRAETYAAAFRAEGLDCVIAGGSVFAAVPEVKAVRALVCALANPIDTAQGLAPLLASPMFALGIQEFLVLATDADPHTGEVRRRNIDVGLMSDDDVPGLEPLPLLDRARAVMRSALSRVGRDPLAAIARDAVDASGWFVRLERRGPEGRAVAANVLKALDAIAEAEAQLGNAPRRVALAYDAFLAGKQAPGALNEEGGDAVRIMTVHASKGLEFPVVAVADCFTARPASGCLQTRRAAGTVEAVAVPDIFDRAKLPDGTSVTADKVRAKFNDLHRRGGWLAPELVDDVSASDSAAARFVELREESSRLDEEERARLLYVAMTRARDVLILAMDARVGSENKVPTAKLSEGGDLTGRVLGRILPEAGLAADRLVFPNARPGDFELIALEEFAYGGEMYAASAPVAGGGAEAGPSEGAGRSAFAAMAGDGISVAMLGSGASPGSADDARGADPFEIPLDASAAEGDPDSPSSGPLDTFTLAYPAEVRFGMVPEPPEARDSYSYSSVAAAMHGAGEDRAREGFGLESAQAVDALNASALPAEPVPGSSVELPAVAPEIGELVDTGFEAAVGSGTSLRMERGDAVCGSCPSPGEDGPVRSGSGGIDSGDCASAVADGDPLALGSAFHAAAQWMVEMGADAVPAGRLDALCRTWGCTAAQRTRLEEALARWALSDVRREALSWPLVRAEVPFFAPGSKELAVYGAYEEGSIDLLCTDPADPSRALVIDYKTGGSPDETVDALQSRHGLQARIYADALHAAGYARVTCRFVRVERSDLDDPSQPQVVTFEL